MHDRYYADRAAMIEQQLHGRGIQDPRVLAAFHSVPRHLFVPTAYRAAAYDDTPLPIGSGQTISQPYIVALMTSAVALAGFERVLEVGTGSGYQAALLAQLGREVHTIELLPDLSARAQRVAGRLRLRNLVFHIGDGSMGWSDSAPYEAIVVTAVAPSPPDPLLQQLAEGGRMVIPVATRHGYQVLKLLSLHGGRLSERALASVAFVPLRGRYGIAA